MWVMDQLVTASAGYTPLGRFFEQIRGQHFDDFHDYGELGHEVFRFLTRACWQLASIRAYDQLV